MYLLGTSGVQGVRGNTALIISVTCHLDITMVTIGGSPRVLDNIVVLAIFSAIPNSNHAVV